jgi:uncharacterized protein (TIRG00374 family)
MSEHQPFWRRISLGRVALLVVAVVSFHVVAPSIVAVLGSWPKVSRVAPYWLVAIVVAEAASFACAIGLQRLALRSKRWFAIAMSQLSGNALSQVMPAGAAAGATLQLRMLDRAGIDPTTGVSAFTAFSLLQTASTLFLPLLALPAILFGAPVNRGLAQTAFLGIAGFVVVAALGAVLLTWDRALRDLGRFIQWMLNITRRKRAPITGLPERLLRERNEIRHVLGQRWLSATLLTAGRLGFDYLALLAALAAVGSRPRPSLVLLAYTAAAVLAMIPITPGGIGIVEAGLTTTLTLAGVAPSHAVLATLLYRLASYWLPVLLGPITYVIFSRRYRSSSRPAGDGT